MREERSGSAGSRPAPPVTSSNAAQDVPGERIPKGRAAEGGRQTAGPVSLRSREREPLLPASLLVLPPLPASLLSPPPPGRSVPAPHRQAPQRARLQLPPSPQSPAPPPARRARRSRRRGRWRRPPAPAGSRGRSEAPEGPPEASRGDAAAEDEPAERAVSPAGRSPEG